jgi:hypothetical protein
MGTIPFMATDALCTQFWRGEIPRVYRHELEGFIWVLPWVFFQYKNSSYLPCIPFKKWQTEHFLLVKGLKLYFREVAQSEYCKPEGWEDQWPLVLYFMDTLRYLGRERERLGDLLQRGDKPLLRRWLELPATGEYTTLQLEYLIVWKNMARSLPSKWVRLCMEDVGLDMDVYDDTKLESGYLCLFNEQKRDPEPPESDEASCM